MYEVEVMMDSILMLMRHSPIRGFLMFEEPELVKHLQRDIEQIRAVLGMMYRDGTIRKSARWYYYSPSIVRESITRGIQCAKRDPEI